VRDSETTILFLHIPKAAGTTLAGIAERHYPARKQYRLGENAQAAIERFNQLPEAERGRYRYIAGHFPYGVHEQVPGPYAYMTMLREPIDRVISFYHFIRNDSRHPWHEVLPDSIHEFALNCHLPVFDNGQTRQLAGDWGRIPFGECGPDLLERAKQNLEAIEVVGLREAFIPSLLLAGQRFGWRRLGFQPANRNPDRPTEPVDADTLEQLRQWNKLDLELYAFAKDRFERDRKDAGETMVHQLENFARNHPSPGALRQFMDKLSSRTPFEWAASAGERLTR